MIFLVACAEPAAKWTSGELFIEQIDLGGMAIGESALIVGPDGTSLLVDTGNDAHRAAVRDAVTAATGEPTVDWELLTHYHADHIGGFGAVDVRQSVVTRGPVHLDGDVNLDEYEPVREAGGVELCTEAGCDPWSVDLGDGATFTLRVADGWVGDERADVGTDENARSLGGVLVWGEFSAWFGGDLTGGGKDTPDVEAFVAARIADGPVDVLQLHHHGIDSSTHGAWLDALLPLNDSDHNVIVGATGAYLAAPDTDVVERVLPRLGNGRVWVTEDGMLGGPGTEVVHGDVVVRVTEGGDAYTVQGEGFAAR